MPDDPDLSARAACGRAPARKLWEKAGKVEGSPGSRFLGSGARESDRRSGSTRRGRARAAPMVVGRGGSIPVDSAGDDLGRSLGKVEGCI